MSKLSVEQKDVVIPGEVLAEGMDYLPGDNTYRENDKIYAKIIGLVGINGRVIKITPLSGPYILQVGDKIICEITDIAMSGWRMDTGTAYTAMMNMKDASSRFIRNNEDLSKILAIGDFVVVKTTKVTSQFLIDVTMKEPGLHKISGGRIIKINSQKVPRVIGKQGSMVSLIKQKTGCDITVGQNGRVWLRGTPEGELLAERAILMIEKKSHHDGLTDKIEKFLDENKIDLPEEKVQSPESQDDNQAYDLENNNEDNIQ